MPPGWTAGDVPWSPDQSPLLAGINPDLQRWLALALPPIVQRLQEVLQLADAARLPEALLLVPGRLIATRSHVDLVMDLDAVSLPVRRAGLDANPGWLPCFRLILV